MEDRMALGASRQLPENASLTQAVMIVALCAALNVFGGFTAKTLAIPIVYLDTIGTFVAAVLLGPWWGAAAGVTYNVTASLTFDPGTWPFAIVSIVVALLWGYGIRRFGLGRSPLTFFALGLVVAVVAAIVASPIVLFVFGGATGSASDAITFAAQLAGLSQGVAVFLSNIESNLADKLLAGSLGLALVRALPGTSLAGVRLPAQSRFGTLAMTTGGLAIGVALALVAMVLPHG
jgi:energy-coupling factor transport system substrate-specific component